MFSAAIFIFYLLRPDVMPGAAASPSRGGHSEGGHPDLRRRTLQSPGNSYQNLPQNYQPYQIPANFNPNPSPLAVWAELVQRAYDEQGRPGKIGRTPTEVKQILGDKRKNFNLNDNELEFFSKFLCSPEERGTMEQLDEELKKLIG